MSQEEVKVEEVVEIVEETPEVEQDLSELVSWDGDEDDIEEVVIEEDLNGDDVIKVPEDGEENEEESEESPQTTEKSQESNKEEGKEDKKQPASLEVKVDGEIMELSLDEIKEKYPEALENLKSGVSGSIAVAKRMTELDKERKMYYNEKAEVEKYLSEFGAKVKDGNILGGLEYFGQFANLPGYVIKEQLIAALKPEIEARYALSEEELRNKLLREENEYLDSVKESKTKLSAAEKAKQDLQTSINSVRETHKIEETEWNQAIQLLEKEIPQDQDFGIQDVASKVLQLRTETEIVGKVESAVKGFSDIPQETVTQLTEVARKNPEFTTEDLVYILEQAHKVASEKEVTKELNNKLGNKPTSKNVPEQNKDEEDIDLASLVSWDDDE